VARVANATGLKPQMGLRQLKIFCQGLEYPKMLSTGPCMHKPRLCSTDGQSGHLWNFHNVTKTVKFVVKSSQHVNTPWNVTAVDDGFSYCAVPVYRIHGTVA